MAGIDLRLTLDPAIADFFRQFEQGSPFFSFQYVEVTFGTANTDYDIRHSIKTPNPDDIQYQLVRTDRATTIYNDLSATRKKWQEGYVILRSSAANANCRILLTVKRT